MCSLWTKCFIPIISGSNLTDGSPTLPPLYSTTTYPNFGFDVGGPGVTVALFNQIATSPTKTRRDLILSGTITHQFDNTAEIVYSNSPDICLDRIKQRSRIGESIISIEYLNILHEKHENWNSSFQYGITKFLCHEFSDKKTMCHIFIHRFTNGI